MFKALAVSILSLGVVCTAVAQQTNSSPGWSPPKGSIDAIIKSAPRLMQIYREFRTEWKNGNYEKAVVLSELSLVEAKKELGENSPVLPLMHMDIGGFHGDFLFAPNKKIDFEEYRELQIHHMEQTILIWLRTETGSTAMTILISSLTDMYIEDGRYGEAVSLFGAPQFKVTPVVTIMLEIEELQAEAKDKGIITNPVNVAGLFEEASKLESRKEMVPRRMHKALRAAAFWEGRGQSEKAALMKSYAAEVLNEAKREAN